MTLEERIKRLEDIEEIRYLQSKYQRCLDTRDFNGMADCFTDIVVSSYGNGEMSYNGKENVLKFLMGSMSIDMISAHMIHGGEIDIIDSENAKAKWYLQDCLIYKTYNINIHGTAIYDVQYKNVDGKWLINSIGYKRNYEYKDAISQTEAATLSKVTFLDEIRAKDASEFTGYNKAFKEISK